MFKVEFVVYVIGNHDEMKQNVLGIFAAFSRVFIKNRVQMYLHWNGNWLNPKKGTRKNERKLHKNIQSNSPFFHTSIDFVHSQSVNKNDEISVHKIIGQKSKSKWAYQIDRSNELVSPSLAKPKDKTLCVYFCRRASVWIDFCSVKN